MSRAFNSIRRRLDQRREEEGHAQWKSTFGLIAAARSHVGLHWRRTDCTPVVGTRHLAAEIHANGLGLQLQQVPQTLLRPNYLYLYYYSVFRSERLYKLI